MKTALSSSRSAWSRSRRRRGRRPHEVFGFASNVLIIDGEFRKTFGQCSTLKRASHSLAKTGFVSAHRGQSAPYTTERFAGTAKDGHDLAIVNRSEGGD